MDSFLQNMVGDQEVLSQGIFTIDVERASFKLSGFQTAGFEEFPRLLVAWAHCARAEEIECRYEGKTGLYGVSGKTVIRVAGCVVADSDLQVVGLRAFQSGTPKHLRLLADLLSCLCSHYSVQIYSGAQECGLSVVLNLDKVTTIKPAREYFQPGSTVLVVDQNHSQALACGYQPCGPSESLMNPLPYPFHGVFSVSESWPGALAVMAVPSAELLISVDGFPAERLLNEKEKGVSYSLALLEKGVADADALSALVHGVRYPLLLSSEFPDVAGTVVADHLKLDLSYQGLVQDKQLQAVQRFLIERIFLLMERALEGSGLFTSRAEEGLLSICDALDSHGFSTKALRGRLQDRSSGGEPRGVGPGFDRVVAWFEDATAAGREQLLHRYRQKVSVLWRRGSFHDLRFYLEAEIRFLQRLERPTYSAEIQGFVVEYLGQTSAEVPQVDEPLSQLLSSYAEWVAEGAVAPKLPSESVHPAWYLPMALADLDYAPDREAVAEIFGNAVPGWLEVWMLFSERKTSQALTLVEAIPELRFDAVGSAWSQLFLLSAGSLKWTEAIRLRALASISDCGTLYKTISKHLMPSQLATEPLSIRQEGELHRHFQFVLGRPIELDFWPRFLLFLESARLHFPETVYRRLWAGFMMKLLFEGLQANEPADLLRRSPVVG